MQNKSNPVVWITGASKGIGKEIANSFASIGCRAILSSRNLKNLKIAEKNILKRKQFAKAIVCDVSNEVSVKNCYKKIKKQFGKVDILINNAGVTEFLPFDKTNSKQFDTIINTNLKSIFLCTKEVLGEMKKRKSGIIINILSVAATKTFLNSSIYSASKAGALSLSKSIREENRKYGIRVIDILPGAVNTDMWTKSEKKIFKNRMLNAKDIADLTLLIYCQPNSVMIEELVVRPQLGDI
ncbi:MAG: SDR family NAD(P)-dependent oxidoreductase [Bacteroidetes bacterium]|nr:SDR family NAD(P)-dependent oxidoreductase [Bacteroidota bacterium]